MSDGSEGFLAVVDENPASGQILEGSDWLLQTFEIMVNVDMIREKTSLPKLDESESGKMVGSILEKTMRTQIKIQDQNRSTRVGSWTTTTATAPL